MHQLCWIVQADAAMEEHQRLLMLITALHPHKDALTLQPLDSQRSSVDSSATTVLLSEIEAAAAAKNAVEEPQRSPAKSQPKPHRQLAFSPGACSKRRAQSARPAECTGESSWSEMHTC